MVLHRAACRRGHARDGTSMGRLAALDTELSVHFADSAVNITDIHRDIGGTGGVVRRGRAGQPVRCALPHLQRIGIFVVDGVLGFF